MAFAQGVALVLECGWIKGLGQLLLQLLPLVLPINTGCLALMGSRNLAHTGKHPRFGVIGNHFPCRRHAPISFTIQAQENLFFVLIETKPNVLDVHGSRIDGKEREKVQIDAIHKHDFKR